MREGQDLRTCLVLGELDGFSAVSLSAARRPLSLESMPRCFFLELVYQVL